MAALIVLRHCLISMPHPCPATLQAESRRIEGVLVHLYFDQLAQAGFGFTSLDLGSLLPKQAGRWLADLEPSMQGV